MVRKCATDEPFAWKPFHKQRQFSPKVYIGNLYQTTSQCLSSYSCTITVLRICIWYTSQATYANTTNFEKFLCGFLQMPSIVRTVSHRMSVPCLRNVCIVSGTPMLCPWIGHGVWSIQPTHNDMSILWSINSHKTEEDCSRNIVCRSGVGAKWRAGYESPTPYILAAKKTNDSQVAIVVTERKSPDDSL